MATLRETPAMVESDFRLLGGVPVVYGGVSTWGHYEEESDAVLGEDGTEVIVEREAIVVATGILPELRAKASITVDGEPREILTSGKRPGSGGVETEIQLALRDPANRAHRRS